MKTDAEDYYDAEIIAASALLHRVISLGAVHRLEQCGDIPPAGVRQIRDRLDAGEPATLTDCAAGLRSMAGLLDLLCEDRGLADYWSGAVTVNLTVNTS